MGVSSSIGPISGINYGNLITGLTAPDQAAIDAITTQVNTLDQQNTALTGLATLMTSLKISAANFTSPATFRAATATSANTSVLNATAGVGASVGNYSFNVQRLASASQSVTQGFADANSTALTLSGNITLQLGGGNLDNVAQLSQLNGGAGVARGSIRVTDRSGASALIDLSHAVDINDVVNTINSATGVNVVAKISGDKLEIDDNSGGTGNLSITNAGGTTAASDLGLVGSVAGAALIGTSLTKLSSTTSLNNLNDGNGIRTASGLSDFTVTSSGASFNVALTGAKTVGDVVNAINSSAKSAGNNVLTAAVSTNGTGITLTDSGGGSVGVAAQNNSLAAYDLGILGTGSGGTLAGSRITSTLTGPLLRDLNGGNQGQSGDVLPVPGTITINGTSVDLSGAQSLTDVISTINGSGSGVTAALNDSATGITLSSNAASFTVADGTGNLASFLHVAGSSTATATGSQITSGNLNLRYLSQNTLLSTLNGGTGISAGSILITDGNNNSQTIALSGTNITTIGDVINSINKSGLAISARIDDTGSGIQLTQTGGAGTAKVQDVGGGTTAESLGIAGTFANNQLDGTFRKTIAISSTDTLNAIAAKINNASAGVTATVINDGSGATPFRLSLSSRNSGAAGRLVFDGSGAGLDATSLLQGEDAAVVYGGNANGTGGLLATSSSNNITGLVPSLTLNLSGVGTTTVSVTNDNSKIEGAVSDFVNNYNSVVNNIADLTKFDSTNASNNGVLFGNSTAQQVQDALGLFITQSYTNAGGGPYQNLSNIGITVNQDGTLTLDPNALSTALTNNPDQIRSLFTTNTPAVAGGPQNITAATLLSSLKGTTPFNGGHITVTDGFGVAHDVDLTSATTIGDVITAINNSTAGTVRAGLNGTSSGLQLTQVGGGGNAQVSEAGGGAVAASLGIKGTFSSGSLNGVLPAILAAPAVKGIGATLSDLASQFTDSQTGLLFQSSDAIQTQEQQLKDHQSALEGLLVQKKNQYILQFANLEVTISQLQSQGSALSSIQSTTSSSSTTKTA